MNSISLCFRGSRRASPLCAAWAVLALLPYSSARAQAPPVPAAFQDLYSSLNTYLTNFNTTLGAPQTPPTPALFSGNLKNADANAGPALVNPATMAGIQLQLQELQAMGVQAVTVEIGFPALYQPFLASQGQTYAQWVTFYQQIAALVHGAGLKLIVENDTLLVNDVQAGWNAAPFFATLDWPTYQQARAQMALTIAQTMQPDYLVALEEPITEANDSGQSEANTPSGSASLLSEMLASLQQAGVPGMLVGAGTGTSQGNSLAYIQEYAGMPVDFIDFHVYPINFNNLPTALEIASIAAAAGKPVAMTECWLWKVRDSELGVLTDDQVRARDPFSFWAPLDAYFIQTIENLAGHTQMLFMDPFDSEYYAAYLPYGTSTENLTPSQIISQESAQANQNEQEAMYTSTALSYYASLVVPPDTVPPSVPTGVAGTSDNPNATGITWNASTDNVGVAGYYVLRNGSIAATAATLYYQDTGLTTSTTYTYTIEAFDLGGNVSAPSLPISVTTKDVVPPSTPGNLVATPANCQKVTLTWSPSTDNEGVGSYLVFWGISPGALAQVARTSSTNTSYTSYPLTCGATYYYGVEAVDTSGNVSAMSAIVSVTTPMPPTPPAGLAAAPASTTNVGLTWSAATSGGLPIQYYHVFRGSSAANLGQVATTGQTSYTDNSANPSTTYFYAVQAVDTGFDVSALSGAVSATTPAPPSAPTNLAFTPLSDSSIGLTWSPAVSGGLPIKNYRVYRGTASSNLTQVAVDPQTGYNDSSVSAGTTYYYAVAAADSAGDLSPMSAILPVAVTSAPSAPAGLGATPVSAVKIGLTWSAAVSGGLPIRNYSVFRGASPANLSQVATVGQPAYNDTSASPATTYYYAVQATDTGGDVSAMSATVSATTPALPSAPTSLAYTPSSDSSIGLTWSPAASGGLPIQNYRVYRGTTSANLSQMAVVQQTAYNDSTVSAGTTYYYAVAAADSAGDLSPMSATLPVAVPFAPSAPAGLTATPASAVKISLTWSVAASGGLPIRNYSVFRGASPASLTQIATVGQPAYNDTSVSPATTYYYAVQATDTGGDVSAMSATVPATTPALPSAPANLASTPLSDSSIGLTWSPAVSGGLPIQNYRVYRGATSANLSQTAVVQQTAYNDSTVSAGTTYYYAVAAADSAGDLSPMSATLPVVVPSAPSAPAGLAATPVSTVKISLSWSVPVSGGLPIRNYSVFRGASPANLSQIATVGQPAYNDASGSPSTTYYYAVQATDTGGDVSAMSATVSATTLALPSAPTNLVATAPSKIQVSLTWTAAQSGMPLQSYDVFRGTSPSTLTSLKVAAATQDWANDGTVSSGATYYYAVQSQDTGGNTSPMSAVVSVTTP